MKMNPNNNNIPIIFILLFIFSITTIQCGTLLYGNDGVELLKNAFKTPTITIFGLNATDTLQRIVAKSDGFLQNSPYSYVATHKDYTFDYTLSDTQPIPHPYNYPFW
jgi:hypothetical protein